MLPRKIFDHRMNDGSRNFADLPESVFFDKLREIVESFKGTQVTGFITDWVTEVWLDFDFRGHQFVGAADPFTRRYYPLQPTLWGDVRASQTG